MKQTLQSIFSITILAAVFTNATAQTNKLSFKPGQKFQTESVLKSTTSMEMMGQQMDIVADVTASRQVEIKDKKESTYTIASTITKMTTNASVMGQDIKYDSEKKEDQDSEVGKALKDKINVPVEMEMNESGKVTSKKKEESKEDKDKAGMSSMMSGMGAGADESNAVEDVFLVLPSGVKQDDKWNDSTIGDGVKTYRNYAVKSISGSTATIAFDAKQNINKIVENQGMEMNMVMENKMTGEVVVDINTNVVLQKTITTDGTGSMDVMGQSVPMTNKTTITSTTKGL